MRPTVVLSRNKKMKNLLKFEKKVKSFSARLSVDRAHFFEVFVEMTKNDDRQWKRCTHRFPRVPFRQTIRRNRKGEVFAAAVRSWRRNWAKASTIWPVVTGWKVGNLNYRQLSRSLLGKASTGSWERKEKSHQVRYNLRDTVYKYTWNRPRVPVQNLLKKRQKQFKFPDWCLFLPLAYGIYSMIPIGFLTLVPQIFCTFKTLFHQSHTFITSSKGEGGSTKL